MTIPADFADAVPGGAAPEAAALLEVRGLTVTYARRSGRRPGSSAEPGAKAVRDVAMSVSRGETLGLVGESGSGKTSIGLAILNLIPAAGSVVFDGEEILGLPAALMRPLRRRMQMVFQDPTASLDPRMTVRRLIGMPIRAHDLATGAAMDQLVASTLEKVSLSPALMDRYPHQLSGGQRQRVAIARALATSPDFIVCDEITSSLDVSVQAQVVNLLMDLQADLGLTLLFISHNLGVVRQVSSTIVVLYLGRVIEAGPAEAVYARAAHPYTRALLEAVPSPDPAVEAHRSREFLRAGTAAPRALASWSGGCAYRARCPFATDVCREVEPDLAPTPAGHLVACHRAEEIRLAAARRSGDDT